MLDHKLINQLQLSPESVSFTDCIRFIDENYSFSPTAFSNGSHYNEAGENNASCKIFAFGLLQNLTETQVLNCFGEYYRNDVLKNPALNDHQNIRQFILNGWSGIQYSPAASALSLIHSSALPD